jgi:hypothetical protein
VKRGMVEKGRKNNNKHNERRWKIVETFEHGNMKKEVEKSSFLRISLSFCYIMKNIAL